MVREFGAFVSRLLVDHENPITFSPQPSGVNTLHTSPTSNTRHSELPNSVHATHPPRNIHVDNLDFNALPEGQSVAYQELFSWFQEIPS